MFLGGAIDLVGLKLDEDCPAINTPLRQLSELFSTLRAIVVAVRRDGKERFYIVCGAGQVGSQIARHLSDEGNAVTVVDNNAQLVRNVIDALDVAGVVGFASHPNVLAQAGARDADMLIAATSMDEVNMVACQVAHSVFEVPTKIARIRSDSYLEAEWSDLFQRDHLPIDVIISPEAEVAKVTMRRLGSTAAFDIEPFLGGAIDLVGLKLDEDCPAINTPLRQLSELFSTLRAIVVAVRRDGKVFVTHGDDQLFAGDEVYLMAAHEDLNRTIDIFGLENLSAQRIVVVGAKVCSSAVPLT